MSDCYAHPDGLIDLIGDMVKLAREDYERGPGQDKGRDAIQQRNNFASAQKFLSDAGLIEPEERPTVPMSSFWLGGAQLTDPAWEQQDRDAKRYDENLRWRGRKKARLLALQQENI